MVQTLEFIMMALGGIFLVAILLFLVMWIFEDGFSNDNTYYIDIDKTASYPPGKTEEYPKNLDYEISNLEDIQNLSKIMGDRDKKVRDAEYFRSKSEELLLEKEKEQRRLRPLWKLEADKLYEITMEDIEKELRNTPESQSFTYFLGSSITNNMMSEFNKANANTKLYYFEKLRDHGFKHDKPSHGFLRISWNNKEKQNENFKIKKSTGQNTSSN